MGGHSTESLFILYISRPSIRLLLSRILVAKDDLKIHRACAQMRLYTLIGEKTRSTKQLSTHILDDLAGKRSGHLSNLKEVKSGTTYMEQCTEMQLDLTKISIHDSYKKLNLHMARETSSKMLPLLNDLKIHRAYAQMRLYTLVPIHHPE